MRLTLNIYDKRGKQVVRVAGGETHDIMFGTIQQIMSLLEITENTRSWELLMKVSNVYNELTDILCDVFPDVTKEEWNCVKVKELIQVLIDIFKFTFTELLSIPADPKNAVGA